MAKLSKLNPVEILDLREMCATGKLPRIKLLAKLVRLGFIEKGTLAMKQSTREMVARGQMRVKGLSGQEMARALYARKYPPIL